MQTSITIDRLEVFARHGLLPSERRVGNKFELAVTVFYDFIPAAETDDISLTLNYAELTDIILDAMSVPRNLLETVANDIRQRIIVRWPQITGGSIQITKLHPPIPAPTPRATITLRW